MTTDKAIFIIHSEEEPAERALFYSTSEHMRRFGYSVWQYSDWEWREEEEYFSRSKGNGRLDVRRIVRGDLRAFRRTRPGQVDKEALFRILDLSRVIIFVNPVGPSESDGVLYEVELLAYDPSLRQNHDQGWTSYIFCNVDNIDISWVLKEVEFDDSISIISGEDGWEPPDSQIWTLGVLIARHILEKDFVGLDEPTADLAHTIDQAKELFDAAHDFQQEYSDSTLSGELCLLRTSLENAKKAMSEIEDSAT